MLKSIVVLEIMNHKNRRYKAVEDTQVRIKYRMAGNFRMVLISHNIISHAHSACENKNYENFNDRNFGVNFDLTTCGEDRI